MADNYLEKRMDDLRRGQRPGAYRPKLTPVGHATGKLQVAFPPRRVLVTGGASGIGRAIVEAYCKAGCRVAFVDNDTEAGRSTASATGSRFIPLDVADAEALVREIEALIHVWGDLDIIVNNVGISRFTPLEECSVEEFDRTMAVNLRPVFVTARTLARYRRAQLQSVRNPYGRIINIASTRAFQSVPGTEAYSASKGGVVALTHALMMSLAPLSVTVNAISPGWIVTDPEEQLSEADHAQYPSGRAGTPADVARLCLWLSLPDNNFINGENITLDGGMTRRMQYV